MPRLSYLLLLLIAAPAFSQVTLEQYNIDASSVTVSGISSGAAFATQYHVIHSDQVNGAAMFAGVVYFCAFGVSTTALVCMSSPALTNVNLLTASADSYASSGDIDGTSGMSGDKVYIFAGTEDTVVDPGNGPNIATFYQAYGASIKTEYTIAAEHCQPTDYYGPSCNYLGGEYINDCSYNGAYEALNYMYDNSLTRPSESIALNGEFSEFNQKEFFPLNSPSAYSMDDIGYIYVPSGCVDKSQTCKLHVAFHGCEQGRQYLSDSFARNTGYLQVAEANNVIVLFPQVINTVLINGHGCWDWWGYTGSFNYATNNGDQVKGIYAMIDRLLNG